MRHRLFFAAVLLILTSGCSTKLAKVVDPMDRARAIQAKVAEAETLGARSCSPRELAKLKVTLEHVVHEWEEGYYTAAWLEPDLAAAERTAEDLLQQRRVAASLGSRFQCVSAR